MQRTRFSILAGFLCFFAIVACSENPNNLKTLGDGRPTIVVTPTETLDQSVVAILALLPHGLATAATARWDNVKRQYAAGLSDPSQMTVAKQMLFELSDWVNKKTPEMGAPPNNETKAGAAARAILYMSMYVYNGPETNPPPFTRSADVVVGLVTPGAPATIVTPTKHAGVQLEVGSVAENTIVVITQNPTPYPANCSGPLQTRLCQYPQFYTFDEFPHKRLLKPGKFNVCHVNTGENRYPLADHDRFRLAHAKPADPADYTPGSTIRDQNGESIEILPLIAQTFSTCVGNFYAKNTVPGGISSRFARGIQNIITPRTAYAIDLGLGGLSVDFSPFNDVDPLGLPDLTVQSMSVAPTSVLAGAHVTLSYAVKNVGTATGAPVPATIFLTPPAVEGPPPIAQQIGSITIPSLVPGATDTRTDVVVAIPQPLPPGTYHISLVVGSDPVFPDADPTNNSASAILTINRSATGLIWSIVPSGTTNFLLSVWGTSASDVWAVGAAGTILHYDGTTWSSVSSGTTQNLGSVWGTSASDVWAVGGSGTILHYNGTTWSSGSSGTAQALFGVWGTSASDVWVVGQPAQGSNGTILHYNGTSWSSVSSGVMQNIFGVWGTTASDVWAVGYGTILHFTGTSWSSVSNGTTVIDFHGIWGSSASDVWAVGYALGIGGMILHYNGTNWSSASSGPNQFLNSVWGTSASDVWAVGNNGTILHGPPAG